MTLSPEAKIPSLTVRNDLINISESDEGGCESIYNFTKEVGAVLFSRCGCNELLISHFVLCEEQIVLEVTKEQTTYRCVVDILIVKVIRPIQMPSSSEGR